ESRSRTTLEGACFFKESMGTVASPTLIFRSLTSTRITDCDSESMMLRGSTHRPLTWAGHHVPAASKRVIKKKERIIDAQLSTRRNWLGMNFVCNSSL